MDIELPHGQKLSFSRHGDEAATPLILLHGLSSNRATYAAVVDHMLAGPVKNGDIQVVNVDLRGHGQSGHAAPDSYDALNYAADIAALIETMFDRPALVVGHSLGGVVAASLAASRPDLVAGLFLEDPPLFEGDAEVRNASPVATIFPAIVAAVRELQSRHAPLSEYLAVAQPLTPPDEVDARCAQLASWDPATMQAAVDGLVWVGFDPEAALSCPVTILQADPAYGSVFKPGDGPRVLAANPHANIVPIAGASHGIHSTATLSAYLDQLDTFISSMKIHVSCEAISAADHQSGPA